MPGLYPLLDGLIPDFSYQVDARLMLAWLLVVVGVIGWYRAEK